MKKQACESAKSISEMSSNGIIFVMSNKPTLVISNTFINFPKARLPSNTDYI